MKPFNLEEYLKDPSKKVVTRDGRSVRIICTDRLAEVYPVVALWLETDYQGHSIERVESYAINGRYTTDYENDIDLFFAVEKKEGWINIYADAYRDDWTKRIIGGLYSSEEEAKEKIVNDGSYIATLKIEWEE